MKRILIGMILACTVTVTLLTVNLHYSTVELESQSREMGFGARFESGSSR
jgi:hypothetical protein